MLQAWAARTEMRARPPPQREKAPDCPRCNSAGTRFCGYRLRRAPRYFCRACGRYWTEECPLRRRSSSVVPVGGGSREKNKRRRSAVAALSVSGAATSRRSLVIS